MKNLIITFAICLCIGIFCPQEVSAKVPNTSTTTITPSGHDKIVWKLNTGGQIIAICDENGNVINMIITDSDGKVTYYYP